MSETEYPTDSAEAVTSGPVARIYRPARNAMQQGRANTRKWLFEFEPAAPKSHDPLMGWISSPDTRGQIKLRFDSKDEAVAYAKRHAIPYRVFEPKAATPKLKSYAANFAFNRIR
ncbi:MAG TPA: ETC complex I subunit [Alphaproteobacteria bacterium]|nr:ETC complex I subunit [Alphaproteobacteria bacterium]